MSRLQTKDPSDVIDVGWDWNDRLAAGETISTKEILAPVPTGITAAAPTETAGVVTSRVSGGTAGVDYELTCRVTTSLGQQHDGTIQMAVRER